MSKNNVNPTNNTSNIPNCEASFTSEDIFNIFDEINFITTSGKSRSEQFGMIIRLARKYNATFNG